MKTRKNHEFSGSENSLPAVIAEVADYCIDCRKCTAECAFLDRYGSPGAIARSGDPLDPEFLKLAYECSLCGLCSAVCQKNLRPDVFFREMRRAAVTSGAGPLRVHGPLLAYERRGMSRRYTWYGLPAACHTVFFPGCTFPGTRPNVTDALFQYLKTCIPGIGIVFDCCGKPSHDLGRTRFFKEMFSEMKTYLVENGIQRVVTACPNCFRVFSEYGKPIEAVTVYEILHHYGLPKTSRADNLAVTLHDPCVFRFDTDIHLVNRRLLAARGFAIQEMPHHREKTLCCGEGGGVGCVNRDFSARWRNLRQQEAGALPMLTCCAGCANLLKGPTKVYHLIDAVFDPKAVASGRVRIARAPMTYLNRLRLKARLRKREKVAASRERPVLR